MASCKCRIPAAAGLNVWLCCALLLTILTLRGVCAKTVLYNKSGKDLVLIFPQQHQLAHARNIEVPEGKSVELQGVQQQRGVVIRDKESAAVAGPLDFPDHHTFEVLWVPPSTSTSSSTSTSTAAAATGASKLARASLHVGNLLAVDLGIS